MRFKTARKVFSVLLVIVTVIGGCVFTGAILVKNTLCSQKIITRAFSQDYIQEAGKKNFENKTALLSAKSNIPERVFYTALKKDTFDSGSAIERFFENHDTTLNSNAQTKLFEDMCREYLDGNNIDYDEEQIHLTALRATEIYSESYGLKNTESAKEFIEKVNTNSQKYISAGLLLASVSLLTILMLYNHKKKAFMYIFSSLTACGISYTLISILSLISGVGKNPAVLPSVYGMALTHCVREMFLILLFIGVIVTALSAAATSALYKSTKSGRN